MKLLIYILLMNSFVFASNNMILPESTVAVVDGTAISEDELDREVAKLLPRSYFHATVDEKKINSLKIKAIDSLIESTLLYNHALSQNININEKNIDETIEKLEDEYGSRDKLIAGIKNLGFTIETLKKAIKKDMVLKKFQEKKIDFTLTDKELMDYYEKNLFKFKEPEKIKISLIYSRNDPTDSNGSAKAKLKIEKALNELNEGENFAYVAQTYSDDMSRVMGGDMGFLHKGRLDSGLEEIAFNMDANTTSEIIEKDIGFYIIRVEKKKEQNLLKFEDIKEGLLTDLKSKEETNRKAKLLDSLMSKAVIIKK